MNLAIIITYCSTEKAFIRAQLRESLKCTRNVIVSVGTHKYNMEEEDRQHIDALASEFPSVSFVIYEVKQLTEQENPLKYRPNAYWHNISRIAGWQSLPKGVEWVLFVDADEIVDAELLVDWLKNTVLDVQRAYKLANYWYFRSPTYQATTYEDSILLIHVRHLSYNRIMKDMERIGMTDGMPTSYMVVSRLKRMPMFHHFSWVRSKEDMLKKVECWGHKGERDWEAEIHEEFSRQFNGRDFVHGYEYREVPNLFDISV